MWSFTALPLLLAVSSSVLAFPAVENGRADFKSSVVEKLRGPPRGWMKDEDVVFDKSNEVVRLRIQLVQQDMDKFHDLALKIATPGHDLYGSHLNQEVIDDIIAPKDESVNLVLQWLKSEGFGKNIELSPRADAVIVHATISEIEKLLHAEYNAFVNSESGNTVIRTLEYSLPNVLQSHVKMVQPTTFFGLRTMKSTVRIHDPVIPNNAVADSVEVVKGCDSYGTITPQCLANLYSFASATKYTNGKMGIAGFLEQWPFQSDLAVFMKNYATEGNTNETFTCTLVNNGTCPQTIAAAGGAVAGTEANLDVQYARAITESIPNVYYSTGGRPPWLGTGDNTNEPYLEFLNYMLNLSSADLPNTLSISYGDDEATVPLAYAETVCNLFSQLGARGVSILVASGDGGVDGSCTTSTTETFLAAFPASCPWVTTVGGTTGNSPEAAWGGSGGGFSSIWGRPSYQNTAVSSWLTTDTTHVPFNSFFNQSGRAYPDVAAQSTNFQVVIDGRANGVDGTSCATPTFASIIQLLNSDRLLSGKAPLGFLNPWLYSNATSGFTDITTGASLGGCSSIQSGAGFNAVKGWDPATGLGTPIYTSLLAVSKAT